MHKNGSATPPACILQLESETETLNFTMQSDRRIGSLLRTLAASKPGARILELGTGTGLSAAWLLNGMDKRATLVTIDNDYRCSEIARKYLGKDPRISILFGDATQWLTDYKGQPFDLVFADTWAGKYQELETALNLLSMGGIYLIDDMEEQQHWPPGHKAAARKLANILDRRKDLFCTRLNWASGIIIAVKTSTGLPV